MVKNFTRVALAGVIGLSGLGLIGGTVASAEENNLPTVSSANALNKTDIKHNFAALGGFSVYADLNSDNREFDTDNAGSGDAKANDVYYFTVTPLGGGTYSYVNFWMDKYSTSNKMTFEVYKNNNLIQRATSQGRYAEVRDLRVTSGTYVVKVFDPTGSNDSSVRLRARIY
ncbi:hypothetical protein CN977_21195 [Bacillus thuringiensis]|uniref:hypothetical protein n=1 Tax=Bacillus thuringiensis TaxID=1428 RepID=UPI000BFE4AA5|nr:hypothetical protein [Bacillus thuringiensis]PGO43065.1 hypothetical protein CN977_21195 [Bacillus thuringiensis]